jgi:uncharacterized repeat protein (TIGR03803 family)
MVMTSTSRYSWVGCVPRLLALASALATAVCGCDSNQNPGVRLPGKTSSQGSFGADNRISGRPMNSQESILYSFQGSTDGDSPLAGLVRDSNGAVYGSTLEGGNSECGYGVGCGVVFKLSPGASGFVETALYSFVRPDFWPNPGLIIDQLGNLYGTTSSEYGSVFELSPSGNGYSRRVLYEFKGGVHGENPQFGVVEDKDSALYGTTHFGGTGNGDVFKLTPNGKAYVESELYSFRGNRFNDGQFPDYGVNADKSGNLYGVTSSGGSGCGSSGCGTVFKLTRKASKYEESVLHSFTGSSDGIGPSGGLVIDKDGALFGVTSGGGGAHDAGVVFKLTPSGKSYSETVIHSFAGGTGAGSPTGALVLDDAGDLFGVSSGGASGAGVVYKLTPKGSRYVISLVYSFNGETDGFRPLGPLLIDSQGQLFGTTAAGGTGPCNDGPTGPTGCGTVFEISR